MWINLQFKKKINKEKIYNNCRLFFKHWKKNPLNTDHQINVKKFGETTANFSISQDAKNVPCYISSWL